MGEISDVTDSFVDVIDWELYLERNGLWHTGKLKLDLSDMERKNLEDYLDALRTSKRIISKHRREEGGNDRYNKKMNYLNSTIKELEVYLSAIDCTTGKHPEMNRMEELFANMANERAARLTSRQDYESIKLGEA